MSFAAVVDRLRILTNPYPGLRPFETSESHLFFGRDQQVAELVSRLERNRFLAVVGVSGSGKSSLVRAGLIPALERGRVMEAGRRWRIVVTRPGGTPLRSLSDDLQRAGFDPSPVTRSSHGLVDVSQQLEPDESLLVLVDQFEELFRYKDLSLETAEARRRRGLSAAEAAEFVQLLLEAGRQPRPVYVVLTMRSDYIGDCAEFRDLPEALNDCQYLIPRMTREQRKEAIEVPLGRVAISPSLVQRLLNDAGDEPDQLPVLQHALMRTWNHWRADDAQQTRTIELKDYALIGGFENAIDQHAEEVLASVDGAIAGTIFKRLTARGRGNRERRDPTTLDELCAICGATTPDERARVVAVVDRFRLGDATFLLPRDGTLSGSTYIDITHESLIRQWKKLRDRWLPDEQQSAKTFLSLVERAKSWEAGKAEALSGLDLRDALQWEAQRNRTAAWAQHYADAEDLNLVLRFIQSSKKHDRMLRLRKGGLWVAAPLVVVFATMSVYAVKKRSDAERSTQLALHAYELSRRMETESRSAEKQAIAERAGAERRRAEADASREEAVALRLEAEQLGILSLSRQLAARSQLVQAENPNLQPGVLLAVEGLNRSPNQDAEQALRRAIARVPRQTMHIAMAAPPRKGVVHRVARSADGRSIAVVTDGGTIDFIDAQTGRRLPSTRVPAPARVLDIAPGASGTWLVAAGGSGGPLDVVALPDRRAIRRLTPEAADTMVAVSPDGRYAVSGGGNVVRIHELPGGGESLVPAMATPTAIAISPDGRWIAVAKASESGRGAAIYELVLFETRSRRRTQPLSAKAASLAFSQDGQFVAVGGDDGTAHVFHVESGAEPARMTTGASLVSIAISDDARFVATGGVDGTARAFDTATGAEISRISHKCSSEPEAIRAGPPPCVVRAVALSHDGRMLFSGGDDGFLHVSEVAGGYEVARIAEDLPVTATAFAADGRRLVVGSGHVEAARVRVFDAPGWGEALQLQPPAPEVKSIAMSADGRVVAVASNWYGGPWVFGLDRPQNQPAAMGVESSMDSVALSGDGSRGTAAAGQRAFFFERATGRSIQLPNIGLVLSMVPSRDGRFAVVGTGNLEGGAVTSIRLPDATETMRVAMRRPPLFMALSGNGRWIAVSGLAQDPVVHLIDAAATKEIWQHAGQTDTVVAFSSDSRAVALVSADGSLRTFDVATGKEIARLAPERGVRALSFAERDRYLIAASVTSAIGFGSEVIVSRYPLRVEDLIANACTRVTGNLSEAEWKQHVGADVPYNATCPTARLPLAQ